jgi:hypothetical protein
LRTLLLMHDGVSFDKILPKQVGYFGTWINWKQRSKIENSVTPLAAPRRGLVLQVPHWQICCKTWYYACIMQMSQFNLDEGETILLYYADW